MKIESLIWRPIGEPLPCGHQPVIRRTFFLDGGPIEVEVSDRIEQDGRVFVTVLAVAAHRCASTPAHFIPLERLKDSMDSTCLSA